MMMAAETPDGKRHHALTQGSARAGQALLISTSQLTSLRFPLSVSAIRNSLISLHCAPYTSVYTSFYLYFCENRYSINSNSHSIIMSISQCWLVNLSTSFTLLYTFHTIRFYTGQMILYFYSVYMKSSFPKRYKSILIVFMKMTFFYLDPYILLIFNLSC